MRLKLKRKNEIKHDIMELKAFTIQSAQLEILLVKRKQKCHLPDCMSADQCWGLRRQERDPISKNSNYTYLIVQLKEKNTSQCVLNKLILTVITENEES